MTKKTTWQHDLTLLATDIKRSTAVDSVTLIDFLVQGRVILDQAFKDQHNIQKILAEYSHLLDHILCHLWRSYDKPAQNIALIAVGGYGRQEMHPLSDIDLLIVLDDEAEPEMAEVIGRFITQLWDLKLEIGQSVRTLDQCVVEAENDLTVITNLIEARHLCGDATLLKQLNKRISTDKIWPSAQFFQAKLGEKSTRYENFGDTAYRVEPNLKQSPGGLRDIQMISWVTKRAYCTLSLKELRDKSLITEAEYKVLIESRDFLWRVRYAIHQLSKRKDDRLLLEFQQPLATLFAYKNKADEPNSNHAVEQFMQKYFRVITEMERMSELLLGIFREQLIDDSDNNKAEVNVIINDWCERRGQYLNITQCDIFTQHPHTLLEIFYLLQTNSGLRGLSPSSIRMIHSHLSTIDDEYRNNPKHKRIFMQIMSESHGITYTLRRMNRYGLLAAWIPEFANIVGRMQFDLFHSYTVDDHSLRVINYIRRNSVAEGAEKMPYESLIFKSLPDPRILYISGLFHDIAKGRGGNHSELGAIDAYHFARSHELGYFDAELIKWIVKNHLLLSMTAQRKDTSDPDVIAEFANKMGDADRLDYLYLLTIADMKATNPSLLNGWKLSLLQTLHKNTRKVLKLKRPPASYAELSTQKKCSVLEQLPMNDIDYEKGEGFCTRMGDDYLLNHSVDTILWQMSFIQSDNVYPIIQLKFDSQHNNIMLFIYTHGSDRLFNQTTSVLERFNINTVAAFVMQTPNKFSLATLQIIDQEDMSLLDSDNQRYLIDALRSSITDSNTKNQTQFKLPRLLKAFNVPTQISFSQDREKELTQVSIRAMDYPGVLSRISRVFYQHKYHLVNAKIATLGEEVEDIFYITDHNNQAIEDEALLSVLKESLTNAINPETST
ncbi:MAG: [protein-PII] uridylyltransferase [Thiotrichaceae bacterium]|nr:[protein-PII] uridylyltransferase [Thiotrichaceae bacterium]